VKNRRSSEGVLSPVEVWTTLFLRTPSNQLGQRIAN
jgi:hypothetical protein